MPIGFWVLVTIFFAVLSGMIYTIATAPSYALPTTYELGRMVGIYFLPVALGVIAVLIIVKNNTHAPDAE
jgi:hypothetical protein